MNFKEYLNESPMMFDSKKERLKELVSSYDKVMKSKPEKVGYFNEYDAIKYGRFNNVYYALVDHENKTVLYDAHLERYKVKDNAIYAQAFLWKDDKLPKDALLFMMNIMLDEHKMILSDISHTKGGRSFWKGLIEKYVGASRYEVGYLDVDVQVVFYKFEKDDWEETFNTLYKENSSSRFYIKLK